MSQGDEGNSPWHCSGIKEACRKGASSRGESLTPGLLRRTKAWFLP